MKTTTKATAANRSTTKMDALSSLNMYELLNSESDVSSLLAPLTKDQLINVTSTAIQDSRFFRKENQDLHTKLIDITKAIYEASLDLNLPTKVTIWWVLSNVGKIVTLVRNIIQILQRP